MSHLVLHLIHVSWVLSLSTLLPFWFAWGVTSYLSVLLTTAGLCTTYHVCLTMHALSLGHHTSETSCVGEHFSVCSHRVSVRSKVLSSNQVFLILALRMLGKSLITILSLSFDINWRLRSDSIFWWSWAWLLRVSSLILLHHLTTHRAWRNTSSHQIVVLLHETKWVWGWSVMMHSLSFLG